MKKFFTLIELLIVVAILWAILYSMSWLFKKDNRTEVFWNTCANIVVNNSLSFFTNATLWKWFYSWTNIVYPDYYLINYSTWNNNLRLYFTWISLTWVLFSWEYKSFVLSWTYEDIRNRCFNNDKYRMIVSWSNLTLRVSRLLQWDVNNSNFIINWNESVLTWETYLYLCEKNIPCKPIMKINIDKRTQKINNWYCTKRGADWSICQSWWM